MVGLAVSERRAVISPDAINDPRFPSDPGARERFAASSDRTILALPLLLQDRVIGALSLRDRTGRVFSEEEVRAAQALADQAAIALENARLYVTAERRRREAEELARAARTLTESLDVADLAARIVSSLQDILRVRTAGFRLLQPDGSLVALGPPGGAPGYAEPGHVVHSGHGTSGRAIATGEPSQSADVLADPAITLPDDVRERILAAGTRAYLSVLLRAHGVLIGVLTVGDVAGRVYTPDEIDPAPGVRGPGGAGARQRAALRAGPARARRAGARARPARPRRDAARGRRAGGRRGPPPQQPARRHPRPDPDRAPPVLDTGPRARSPPGRAGGARQRRRGQAARPVQPGPSGADDRPRRPQRARGRRRRDDAPALAERGRGARRARRDGAGAGRDPARVRRSAVGARGAGQPDPELGRRAARGRAHRGAHLGDRRRCALLGQRHRRRHVRRGPPPGLRAVLHHEGREEHGPRPQRELRDHPASRRRADDRRPRKGGAAR